MPVTRVVSYVFLEKHSLANIHVMLTFFLRHTVKANHLSFYLHIPLSDLSVEARRFYDIIKANAFAFIGGRSNLDSASLHRLKTIYVFSLHRLKSIYVLSLHRLKTIYVVSPK